GPAAGGADHHPRLRQAEAGEVGLEEAPGCLTKFPRYLSGGFFYKRIAIRSMKKKADKSVRSPIKPGLKTKEDIVNNWLPRYTARPLEEFGEYILLTNFSNYLKLFSEMHDNVPILGLDKPMQSVTADGITIINFGMGSPM